MRNPLRALFERRAIGDSHALWMQVFGGGSTSGSGATVNETTAMQVSVVLTCVSLRSRALASLPVRVYERLDERNKRAAVNHPLSRVLSKPNTWQTRAELFGMLEAHRVLRGNAYAFINRGIVPTAEGVEREQVLELIPMHPDRVEVIDAPDQFGGPTTYKLHRPGGLPPIEMASREVLHLKGLSTDGRRGRSVLQDLREAIGGAIATQDATNNFWKRDGTPSIALTHPNQLGDEAARRLEQSWEALYGGRDGRRIAVLEEGMKIEQLSLSQEDSQFLETRKFQRSELAGAFHVPPHMIGDTEKSTSWGTGIEQQQIGFLVFTLRPDLVLWEQRLTMDLVTNPSRFFIEFSVDGMLRGDATARSAFYWRMVQMGALSPNEVRAFENLNPIEGGDVFLVPMNVTTLDKVGEDDQNTGN